MSPIVIENNMLSLDPNELTSRSPVRSRLPTDFETYACDDPEGEGHLQHDLLPSWPDEWLVIEREGFRQLRLHALDALCLLHARAGRYARAVAAGMASVASEVTRESAHRALMTAHLLEGNRMEALRQYHRYLALARTEMGIGPSDHLQRLLHDALEDASDDDPVTLR